jgi:hypothetical protein
MYTSRKDIAKERKGSAARTVTDWDRFPSLPSPADIEMVAPESITLDDRI